jgi:hypothetical protein
MNIRVHFQSKGNQTSIFEVLLFLWAAFRVKLLNVNELKIDVGCQTGDATGSLGAVK